MPPLPKRRHRILTVDNGIHGFASWNVESLDDIEGPFHPVEDINKVARVWNYDGEVSLPTVHYFALSHIDDSDPELNPIPHWTQLDGAEFHWVEWTVGSEDALNGIDATTADVDKIAKVVDTENQELAYFALAMVVEEEGSFFKVWKRLDNVPTFGLPIEWVLDPEGFPSQLSDIEAYEEHQHRIAYDPSGTVHYWILQKVEFDGEAYEHTWRPLDADPDISGKADKVTPRINFSGTSLTITAGHVGAFVVCTNAALQTVYLPGDSDTPIDAVQSIAFFQNGAGRVRFQPLNEGATVLPPGIVESSGQYRLVHATRISETTWLISGDLA